MKLISIPMLDSMLQQHLQRRIGSDLFVVPEPLLQRFGFLVVHLQQRILPDGIWVYLGLHWYIAHAGNGEMA